MNEPIENVEIQYLSVLLNQPEYVVETKLKGFMFNALAHQTIYNGLMELYASGSIPEYGLLLMNLSGQNKLNEAGGKEYTDLILGTPAYPDNLRDYESKIRSFYKTKVVRQLSSAISGQIAGGMDIDNLIGTLKNQLDNLEESAGGEQVADMLTSTSDMWKNLNDRIDNPGLKGVTTGFINLDVLTGGYNKGDLIIVAGRPGMGKSSQMANSALSTAKALLAKGEGESVHIFSLEMNRISITERLVSIEAQVPLADIRLGSVDKIGMDKISDAIKRLKTLPIQIDSNFYANALYYSASVKKYVKQKNVRVTFFDYLQLASEREANQTSEIGQFTRAAKNLANDLGITNVVYSQLNRAVELREDRRPVLSDLRQSGNIEEDADIVFFLYRDDIYNPNSANAGEMEFVIRKHRNGPTGSIYNSFDTNTLKITPKKL